MKILVIGDVMGRPGRRVVREVLPQLIDEHKIEFAVANAENLAGGIGTTAETAEELFAAGADVLTSGNHIWAKKEIFGYITREQRLLRPINYPPGTPGTGYIVLGTKTGKKVGVISAVGRVFMEPVDCPFRTIPPAVEKIKEETPIIIVDFHAEATSEKRAMGWHLDGSVTAVIGTHTHVPTADAEILPQGAAYITDIGMTGAYYSVIGIGINNSLSRFLTNMPGAFTCAKGNVKLYGALIDADESTGRAKSIEVIEKTSSATSAGDNTRD